MEWSFHHWLHPHWQLTIQHGNTETKSTSPPLSVLSSTAARCRTRRFTFWVHLQTYMLLYSIAVWQDEATSNTFASQDARLRLAWQKAGWSSIWCFASATLRDGNCCCCGVGFFFFRRKSSRSTNCASIKLRNEFNRWINWRCTMKAANAQRLHSSSEPWSHELLGEICWPCNEGWWDPNPTWLGTVGTGTQCYTATTTMTVC